MPDPLPHDKDAALGVVISACEHLYPSSTLHYFSPYLPSDVVGDYDRGFRMADT